MFTSITFLCFYFGIILYAFLIVEGGRGCRKSRALSGAEETTLGIFPDFFMLTLLCRYARGTCITADNVVLGFWLLMDIVNPNRIWYVSTRLMSYSPTSWS